MADKCCVCVCVRVQDVSAGAAGRGRDATAALHILGCCLGSMRRLKALANARAGTHTQLPMPDSAPAWASPCQSDNGQAAPHVLRCAAVFVASCIRARLMHILSSCLRLRGCFALAVANHHCAIQPQPIHSLGALCEKRVAQKASCVGWGPGGAARIEGARKRWQHGGRGLTQNACAAANKITSWCRCGGER